jgi:hypothetical protein
MDDLQIFSENTLQELISNYTWHLALDPQLIAQDTRKRMETTTHPTACCIFVKFEPFHWNVFLRLLV